MFLLFGQNEQKTFAIFLFFTISKHFAPFLLPKAATTQRPCLHLCTKPPKLGHISRAQIYKGRKIAKTP
jgi:hypothetical protein